MASALHPAVTATEQHAQQQLQVQPQQRMDIKHVPCPALVQARWSKLAYAFVPKCEDAPRITSHHDYLLREARWLAQDVMQVRLVEGGGRLRGTEGLQGAGECLGREGGGSCMTPSLPLPLCAARAHGGSADV